MCVGCDEGLNESDLKAAFLMINQWSSRNNSSFEVTLKERPLCPPPPYFWKLKCNILCFQCNKYIGNQYNETNKAIKRNSVVSKRKIDEVEAATSSPTTRISSTTSILNNEDKSAKKVVTIPAMDPHDYWDFI